MKTLKIILATAAIAALFLNANAQSFITNGLVAYYPFNGNANDASGNGLNGTNNGATMTADRFGNANAAFSFNGSSSYISFATVPTSQTNNWTVSSWIKPAALSQIGTVVSVGHDSGVGGSANGYQTCINSGNSAVSGNLFAAIYGGISTYSSGFAFTSTDAWTQIVLLRTNGIASFFVNGIQVGETVSSNPRVPTSFTIGSANGIRFFKGCIDDVRIYNRALSPSEVAQLYAAELKLPPLEGIAIYSNSPVIFFPTSPGTNFSVQMTTNLNSPAWVTVTNGVPFSGVQITNAPSNAFFRLNALP